jgi:hypothetical protein
VNDSLTIQGLHKECFNGLSEIEGKAQLLEARNLSKENKFKEALAIATKINPSSSVYPDSQKLIEQWSQQLLDIAEKKYKEEGKLDEAIALLQEIPLNTQTGRKIADITSDWKMKFKQEKMTLELAKTALDQGRWEDAIRESQNLKITYFKTQAQPIVDQAKVELTVGDKPRETAEPPSIKTNNNDPNYSSNTKETTSTVNNNTPTLPFTKPPNPEEPPRGEITKGSQ